MTIRRIETRELIATVRRIAKEQKLYRTDTILHLNLAAAELERLAYPSAQTGVKGSVLPTTESVGGLAALSGSEDVSHDYELGNGNYIRIDEGGGVAIYNDDNIVCLNERHTIALTSALLTDIYTVALEKIKIGSQAQRPAEVGK